MSRTDRNIYIIAQELNKISGLDGIVADKIEELAQQVKNVVSDILKNYSGANLFDYYGEDKDEVDEFEYEAYHDASLRLRGVCLNKAELKKYISLKNEAEELKLQAERLEEDIRDLKAVVMDGMPKGSAVNDSIGNLIAKADKLRREYLHKYDLALCELYKIERAIEGLENETERRLMRKRYIEGKRWEDVCVEINHNWSHTHRIHANILKKIEKMG